MAIDLHTVAIMTGSSPTSFADRLLMAVLKDVVTPAGNGAVASIGVGTPGTGYASIPTVALTVPVSGAKNTGASATATAVMGVQSATVAAGGSGGTNGTQTVTGTTGTGTKFQASVTVAGGAITAVLSITVAGAYTVMPTLAGEPVTGASLTGATLNISLGVVSYTVGAGGTNYPVGFVTATVSGGTPTTAAVPGAVTVTPAAGASAAMDVALNLPASYTVQTTVASDATEWVSGKTQTGFIVNFSPRLAASTLAASTVDIMVVA